MFDYLLIKMLFKYINLFCKKVVFNYCEWIYIVDIYVCCLNLL